MAVCMLGKDKVLLLVYMHALLSRLECMVSATYNAVPVTYHK